MLRKPILKSLGLFLVVEDSFEFINNAFVLSGGAFDRGNTAAFLYEENKIGHILCTGGNKSTNLEVLGLNYLESELSKKQILVQGVPDTAIELLPIGSSTFEEAMAIQSFCKSKGLTEIVVVSSKFHTRRIALVFKKRFKKEGITVYIHGASSSSFEEKSWWESENGLIALNNEYIKLLYYLLKY